jgi:hypothetical protein
MELVIKYFISLTEITLLIPIIFALRSRTFWKGNKTLILLAYFLLVSFVQVCIVTPQDILILMGHDTPNTVFYYNWQYVITAFIKLGIYYTLLNFNFKRVLIGGCALILLIFIGFEFRNNSLTFYNTEQFVTNTYLIVNLFIIILSLLYAFQQLQDLTVEDITKYSFFWLNAGFLVYHFGSIFVYSFVGNGADKQDAIIAWVVNGLLLLFLYGTMSFAYHYSKNLSQSS